MASKLKILTIYDEDDYEEKCIIEPNSIMNYETLPKFLTLKQRAAYDSYLHGLHHLMVKGTIKKIELEEEEVVEE